MNFELDFILRQEWRDPRLAWSSNEVFSTALANDTIMLDNTYVDKLWV